MGTIQVDGATPKLTIGNATAEDATILFDGNAQDFYIALDDSADDLLIGLGSTVGTTPAIAIDENLKVNIPVTTASTSASTGSLTTGGGAGIGADLYVGDDAYLITDSAVLGFGADKDTLLTHTDGTGLTLNSTNKLCFNDASQFVQGSSATVLSIGATDEIDLTATAIDINGTADVSGAFTAGSTIVATGSVTGTTIEPNADTSAGDNAAIGYTSAEGLILTGQGSTDDVTIKNDADTTVLQVATGGVDVEITAGNIIMGTSGKGIDFSATGDGASASNVAEVFDDYETGTFTPTVAPTTNSYTTSGTHLGFYTKIGKMVHVQMELPVANVGTGSGNITVSALPFTSAATGIVHTLMASARETQVQGQNDEFIMARDVTAGTILGAHHGNGMAYSVNFIYRVA